MSAWYVIESLRPPAFSILFRDGEERDWTSIRSLTRSEGVDVIEDLCGTVRDNREPLDVQVRGRQGPRRVIMKPVLGWEDDVYAIKTWIGDVDEAPAPERSVAAVNWDIETLTARHTLESHLMSSCSPEGFGGVRDPGQFLRKVVQFDSLNELAELCLNDGTRDHFQGSLTVLHDDSHLMAWRGAARSGCGPDASEVRGIFHDITDTQPPVIGPLTALRLSDLERHSDAPPAVLVAYRTDVGRDKGGEVIPALMYWISPRPEYVAESAPQFPNESALPGNLVHPDDWHEFARARKVLEAGQDDLELPFVARLLNNQGGWTQVRFSLRRYPGAVGQVLHIGRFSPVERTSD